ncbi:MAG: glycosyltransferase family 2 protein [Candidatus Aminicenantes bacterium]|nr:glycosyltransferase family 2 protein [Candidatus Aminicenantes bacterium]HHF51121.1 glycosyltransferase [Candidatus Aminicenantes bacterium]
MMKKRKCDLSLVIPVFNEQESLDQLYKEITVSCEKLNKSYEVIFIDDGSTDDSLNVLIRLQKRDPRICVIRLRKNFGQTAALSAGFDHSCGDIIITLDADLQNDPEDFGMLIDKMEEGYDLVSGWRKKRKDKLFTRRLPSMMANWIISVITRVKLHDYGCTLKAFRREVVKNINLYGEMHRFIPAIASNIGITIAEVEVNHRPRRHGKSKYSLMRFTKVVLDLLTVKFMLSYATRPLQIFGIFGLISGMAGGVIGAILSYQRLVLKQGIADRPLLLLAVLLMVVGFQFITLGLLAEILVRAYHESIGKRIYYIRDIYESDSEIGSD